MIYQRLYHPQSFIFIILTFIYINTALAQSPDISGTWKTEFDSQIGVQKYIINFTQSDSGLIGTGSAWVNEDKRDVVLQDLKVDSNAVSFLEMQPYQGTDFPITYKGKITGDKMTLDRKVADFVNFDVVFERQKEK